MRGLILLIICVMSVSAVEYESDIRVALQRREEAIAEATAKLTAATAKANKEAVDKLLTIVKKIKNKEEAAYVWLSIQTIDPQNEEAMKALEKAPTSTGADKLFPVAPSPFKLITKSQAIALEKMVKAQKYKEKDWDDLPSKSIDIDSTKWNLVVPGGQKRYILIVPHPTDVWVERAGFAKSTWLGIDMPTTMMGREGEYNLKNDPTPIKSKIIWEVSKDFYIAGGNPNADRVGTIRVKIFEVTP